MVIEIQVTPDFATGRYIETYRTLINGTGITSDGRSIHISTEYPNGYTIYIIQLCPGEPDFRAGTEWFYTSQNEIRDSYKRDIDCSRIC